MRDRIECCQYCEERYAGCKITCKDYIRERAELDEANAIRKAKRQADVYYSTKIAEDRAKEVKRNKKKPHSSNYTD